MIDFIFIKLNKAFPIVQRPIKMSVDTRKARLAIFCLKSNFFNVIIAFNSVSYCAAMSTFSLFLDVFWICSVFHFSFHFGSFRGCLFMLLERSGNRVRAFILCFLTNVTPISWVFYFNYFAICWADFDTIVFLLGGSGLNWALKWL